MTESTDTKNITKMINSICLSNGVDCLKLEMDLVQAFKAYWHEREDGKSPAEARDKVMEILKLNSIGADKLDMQKRVEAALNRHPNWDDLKQDWNGFDRWLLEKEKDGQTIEAFVKWHNGDPFRAKGVIYLTPQKIMDWWGQAFEVKTDEARPAYNPIPERVRTPRPAHIPPPNIPKRSINDNTTDRE